MRTMVYVDGFNLYHSALESRPEFRWLDLHAMATAALGPAHEISSIRYFSAPVKGWDGDQGGPQRQDAYVRALQAHCQTLSVHMGRFVRYEKWKRLVHPLDHCLNPSPTRALTWHREEKGSDVNLAVHMLNDAWAGTCECAVLISDDSDLAEPLRMIRSMGKYVVLLTPIALQGPADRTPNTNQRLPTKELRHHAHAVRHLTVTHLAKSQLPDIIHAPNGRQIRRPAAWIRR